MDIDFFRDDYAVKIKDFSEMFNLNEKTPYELIKRHPEHFKSTKKGRHTFIPSSAINFYVNLKQKQATKQIISSYMRKGGVGKTTILLNLAVRSCMHGHKVLLIDLDSQANITRSFKVRNPKDRDTFLNIFHQEIEPMEAVLTPKKNLHVIPANNKLTKLATDIDPMKGFKQFRPFLDLLKSKYDLIFIDCGGLMDMTIFQALAASDTIISPAFPDEYSDEGLELTTEEIMKLQTQGFKPNHKIILNRIDPNYREKATKEYVSLFEDLYPNIAKTRMRKSQEIINATSDGKSIFEHNYDSKMSEEFELLYQEIILGNDVANKQGKLQ